jgi:hypothetical protein
MIGSFLRDPGAVIHNLNALNASQGVAHKIHLYRLRVRIERVPDKRCRRLPASRTFT